jgi:glucose/arabinose dehydrogenase
MTEVSAAHSGAPRLPLRLHRRGIRMVLLTMLAITAPSVAACQPSAQPPGATPNGEVQVVAARLQVPWSVAFVGQEALISERNTGRILAVRPGAPSRIVGTAPNVATPTDGGLLGLAVLNSGDKVWLYAFHSTNTANQIVRLPYEAGRLGAPEVVFDKIPVGNGHNGGRIAFGPDGMLYAATGENRNGPLSQDPNSLAGKILRMTPTGGVPDDNPTRGSVVYSMGHRNPSGLAWDRDGQLWETEFGDKGADELNRIEPGKNYGWPVVEGRAGNPAFVDPVVQWPVAEMGPAGLAYIDGTFFIAGLTGKRLWSVTFDADGKPIPTPHYVGEFGRLRDVTRGPDDRLWIVTNKTDGRGGDTPTDVDDRILSVALTPVRGDGQ